MIIPAVSGAVGPLGPSEWAVGGLGGAAGSIGSIGGASGTSGAAGVSGAASGSGSFGNALSSAINSLETTQANATGAAQGLANGTVTDPTQAVTAVENASLSMDLASSVRDKLVTDVNTIFATQV